MNLDKIQLIFSLLLVSTAGFAEVVTDGTVGPQANIAGPNFDINASYGTQAGNNLFHSFSSFNIGSVESANFSGPASVKNIISRITGGGSSSINGNIASSINGANLWMINPSGFMFGSDASLNVTGSFHVSTGDYVAFDDGSRYQIGQNSNISLLTANPEGFGFLGKTRGTVLVNGSNLSVPVGQSISIVGGDVKVENSALTAVDGTINLAAVSGRGRVRFTSPANPNGPGIMQTGELKLASIDVVDSTVDVSGDGGGSIFIKGGNVVIDADSRVLNGNINSAGGVLRIDGTTILIDGGLIESDAGGTAAGANIVFDAQNLTINNPLGSVTDSGLVSKAGNTAQGGNIILNVDGVTKLDEGVIRTFSRAGAINGDIAIQSDNLKLVNGGKIFASTFFNGGTSGAIDIDTTKGILVDGRNSKIEIQTFGSAIAGDIDLSLSTQDLTLRNGAQISTDSFSAGIGAGILINADNINLSSSAVINARTFDDTGAGISVTLRDSMRIDGGASISTDTFNNGQGSNIDIAAKNLSLSNGGFISASTRRDGNAGKIKITLKGDLSITGKGLGETGLFSVSGDPDPFFQQTPAFSGKGGDIDVSADSMSIERGIISSSAINLGNAGNIELTARDQIVISDSSIVSAADQSAGGNIMINVINLLSLDNSDITAEASGVTAGNDGGNINIDAVNVVLNSSQILARANAGNGGNITIVTEGLILSNDSIIDASSNTGIDGEVIIESPNTDTNAINYDEVEFLDLSSFLNNLCRLKTAKNRSSFVVVGKGGLPSDPGDYQVISLASTNKRPTLTLNNRLSPDHQITSLDTSFLCSD